MILRDINVRSEMLTLEKGNTLNTGAIENLFLKKIKKSVRTERVAKVNIYLTPEKEFRIGELMADVLDCYIYFDVTDYLKLANNKDRKLKLLDTILSALLKCAAVQRWNADVFLDAYNACLKDGLKNEWWFKDKLFKSPDRQFYVGLYNIFDLDGFILQLVVHDKNKEPIARRVVFKGADPDFPLEWASWEETNDTFYFKFNPPKKIFAVKINDVIQHVPYQLPATTSDMFK
jgi:hypothetical protein